MFYASSHSQQSWCSLSCRCIIQISASIFLLTVSSYGCLPSVSMSEFPSFYKDTSHLGLEGYPTLVWPHHNLIVSSMTLFPNKITFWGTRIRTSSYLLVGVGEGTGENTIILPIKPTYYFPLLGSMFWNILSTKQNVLNGYSFSWVFLKHQSHPNRFLIPEEDGIKSFFPGLLLWIQLNTLKITQ